MRKVLTISVDEELMSKLDDFAGRHQISRSELIKRALRKYLYLQEFRRLRSELIPYAERKGYFSDEDIFRDFS